MSGNAWTPLTLEHLGNRHFFGRRKKKLDVLDFVAIKDGFHTIDIAHWKCAPKLIGILVLVWDVPSETYSISSLKKEIGGVPIKHDLHCTICDSETPDWIYEPKRA